MELKDCFKEDFKQWLLQSDNQKIRNLKSITYINYHRIYTKERDLKIDKIVEESLQEILNILLKEPLADYFWYYNTNEISYCTPSMGQENQLKYPVPGEAIRVDPDKIKVFLRDYKIEKILNK